MDALKLNLAELWGDQKGWLIGNLLTILLIRCLDIFSPKRFSIRLDRNGTKRSG